MGLTLGVFACLAGAMFGADVWAHRRADKAITLGNAAFWSCAYIAAALLFAGFLYVHAGSAAASLFLAGYVMEKALSVDNLMVFVAIFAYFKVADAHQHRVLHYGIIGAVVFRLIFVFLGAGSLSLFGAPVALLFGIVVLWSAYKMWTAGGDDERVDYAEQWYANAARWALPFTNSRVDDDGHPRFLLSIFNHPYEIWSQTFGTPLLLCLIAIEISDVMFSFDSVPAVIAITQVPVLVYTAMIFAILGLRMLYFVLTALLRYLSRLGAAVIAVLVFIGIKLIAEAVGHWIPGWGFAVSPVASLAIVLGILAVGVIASVLFPESPERADVPVSR